MIRDLEPAGVTISVGGEIGEVGGKNSTVEELRAYMDGYRETSRRAARDLRASARSASRRAPPTAACPCPTGVSPSVKLDFAVLEELSRAARAEYGLAGAVQHGASTLPDEAFDRFPAIGTAEIHLATGFQNIIYDSKNFPDDLRSRIYDYLKKEAACRPEGEGYGRAVLLQDPEEGNRRLQKGVVGTPESYPGRPRRGAGSAVRPPVQEAQCGGNARNGEPFRAARGCPAEASGRSGITGAWARCDNLQSDPCRVAHADYDQRLVIFHDFFPGVMVSVSCWSKGSAGSCIRQRLRYSNVWSMIPS